MRITPEQSVNVTRIRFQFIVAPLLLGATTRSAIRVPASVEAKHVQQRSCEPLLTYERRVRLGIQVSPRPSSSGLAGCGGPNGRPRRAAISRPTASTAAALNARAAAALVDIQHDHRYTSVGNQQVNRDDGAQAR